MKFAYQKIENWPPLAWIARCEPGKTTISIMHGANVETRNDWFCEAVWDGEFSEGGFDKTDIVAGSGGRNRADQVFFVSAGNTVDRLVSIELSEATFISNSLVCLASVTKLNFRVKQNWIAAFHSIIKGINAYQKKIPSSKGSVTLTYFRNIVWNGKYLSYIDKPIIQRNFSSFEHYYDFLLNTLKSICRNGHSSDRHHIFKPLTTVSTGYDSTMVTALAKTVDSEIEGFTFHKTFGATKDDGSEIAQYLQTKLNLIDGDQWQTASFPEIPHIASDCLGTEIHYVSAESILNSRILLTGFHGDKVWSKNIEDGSNQLERGDQSGLSLSEYRLWMGFIHCPIPFWGARQSADIIYLSNSENMRKWDVSGDYSRPICRRIVESAGVPRELFGRKKKAASVGSYNYEQFLTPESMTSYLNWVKLHRSVLAPNLFYRIMLYPAVDQALHKVFKTAQRIAGKVSSRGHSIKALDPIRKPFHWFRHIDWADNPTPPWVLPLRRHLFPWAIEMAKKKYTINHQSDQKGAIE